MVGITLPQTHLMSTIASQSNSSPIVLTRLGGSGSRYNPLEKIPNTKEPRIELSIPSKLNKLEEINIYLASITYLRKYLNLSNTR